MHKCSRGAQVRRFKSQRAINCATTDDFPNPAISCPGPSLAKRHLGVEGWGEVLDVIQSGLGDGLREQLAMAVKVGSDKLPVLVHDRGGLQVVWKIVLLEILHSHDHNCFPIIFFLI